jgi:hypothetical protein
VSSREGQDQDEVEDDLPNTASSISAKISTGMDRNDVDDARHALVEPAALHGGCSMPSVPPMEKDSTPS